MGSCGGGIWVNVEPAWHRRLSLAGHHPKKNRITEVWRGELRRRQQLRTVCSSFEEAGALRLSADATASFIIMKLRTTSLIPRAMKSRAMLKDVITNKDTSGCCWRTPEPTSSTPVADWLCAPLSFSSKTQLWRAMPAQMSQSCKNVFSVINLRDRVSWRDTESLQRDFLFPSQTLWNMYNVEGSE